MLGDPGSETNAKRFAGGSRATSLVLAKAWLLAAVLIVAASGLAVLVVTATNMVQFQALVVYAAAEETARCAAIALLFRYWTLAPRTIVLIIASAFGTLEISNAFFPDRYASVEAQTAPFALLAAFEFGFGFLLHGALTLLALWLIRRAGYWAALPILGVTHSMWNLMMGA